jgi:putative flippase GtrA
MVMSRLRTLLKRPGYRYLMVGGSVYVFELLVIVVAQRLGASAVAAVAWSYFLGTTLSFFMQKLVTFGDTRMHHRILVPQMIATGLLLLWNFVFSLLVTKLLADHVPAVATRTLALGITTIWNFYLYKTRIFKSAAEELIG